MNIIKSLILTLGLLAGALAAPAAEVAPVNPLERQWTVIVETNELIVGIDVTSFKVITPTDIFTYETLMVGNLGDANGQAVAGNVAMVRVSCKLGHAQVLTDISYDVNGKIIARDLIAKEDSTGVVAPASPVGLVMRAICSGQSLAPSPGGRRS